VGQSEWEDGDSTQLVKAILKRMRMIIAAKIERMKLSSRK